MKITWDEPKRVANVAKHGFDFADLTEEFFEAAVIKQARADRFFAIGRWKRDVTVFVIFAALGSEGISIVSMRHASRKERKVLDGES